MKNKKQRMWMVIRWRRVLSVDDLREIAGVSKTYAYKFMNLLMQNKIIKKISPGKYQIRVDAVTLPQCGIK